MPAVVDLFCGAGGLTHGFIREGFNVVAGIDADKTCRYAYEKNNPGARFIHKSIKELTQDDLTSLYPVDDTKILVGCAPCQPFSLYSNRTTVDAKWSLLYDFAEIVEQVQPDIVSMENVRELYNHRVFRVFVRALEAKGYVVSSYIVHCVRYGIPQTRVRLVLFASRHGKIDLAEATHSPAEYRTVSDAIRGLKRIEAGEIDPFDPLHRASSLSVINLERIRATPEGGTWRDWDDHLILDCHKKETGKSYGSVYGRMSWDKPASTITTQFNGLGNGRFGHPDQDRAISLREGALIQTFPLDYRFVAPDEPLVTDYVARWIGNAVPVRLGQIIARSVAAHLEAHHE